MLRKDGTCFVNLGDSYFGGGVHNEVSYDTSEPSHKIQAKSLALIPQRFAIEMVNRDTMDIYELDKGIVICNNIDVTNNNIGGKYAIQRPDKSKRIQYGISEEVEKGTQRPIPQENERMAGEEQREGPSIQQKILLDSSGTGNNTSNEGECQKTQEVKNGSNDKIWRKSSEVRLLWGNDLSVFNNRPYQRENEGTQSRSNKMWLNLRMVKENELSARFQSFMYELQLGNREIWLLPPSRGKNLCLRKRDIPLELLPLFKLKEKEQWRLRNTIIWHKPNCMPSSANDRFTVDFEYLFFFVKNSDIQFWTNEKTGLCVDKKPLGTKGIEWKDWKWRPCPRCQGTGGNTKIDEEEAEKMGSPRARYHRITKQENCKRCKGLGKIKVSLWTGHDYWFEQQFEPLKQSSIERANYSGTSKKTDMGIHGGMTLKAQHEVFRKIREGKTQGANKRCVWTISTKPFSGAHFAVYPEALIETPIKAGCPQGGIVLDPFMGAGTTALVALKQRKRFIGIEIKQEYIDMTKKRIKQVQLNLF